MVDGEVVEDPEDDFETVEDDVETGSKTSSTWCHQTEEHVMLITESNGDQQSSVESRDVSGCFGETPALASDDEVTPLLAMNGNQSVDLPENPHKAEREEKYSDTGNDNADIGFNMVPNVKEDERLNMKEGEEIPGEAVETIRHSESDVVDIVTDLIDDLITNIMIYDVSIC